MDYLKKLNLNYFKGVIKKPIKNMVWLLALAALKSLITINLSHTVIDDEALIAFCLCCFLILITIFIRETISFYLFTDINFIYICFSLISLFICSLYVNYFSFFVVIAYNVFNFAIPVIKIDFSNFFYNYNLIYFWIINLSKNFIWNIIMFQYYLITIITFFFMCKENSKNFLN